MGAEGGDIDKEAVSFAERARSWLRANEPTGPWPSDPLEFVNFGKAFQAVTGCRIGCGLDGPRGAIPHLHQRHRVAQVVF